MVLALFYLVALFAEFVAPYGPTVRNADEVMAPPQRIYFRDQRGFSLRPFVFPRDGTLDRSTMTRIYTENRSQRYYIQLLARGEPYRLWGVIPLSVHLFGLGLEAEARIHPFGTDRLGRDLFSRIVYGTRISLSIGLVGVAVSLLLGLILGGAAGYFGGVVDSIVTRLSEILRSVPTIPLWIGLSAALPPDLPPLLLYFGVTIILSFVGWTDLARQVRGRVLSLKNEDFVLAARLSGAPELYIIFGHLVPSFMSHVIATLTLAIPTMILGETALSFLGLGLRDPVVSWGVLLQKAQNIHAIAAAPWLLIPVIFVVASILSFNFFGDGLRDAADPYSALEG